MIIYDLNALLSFLHPPIQCMCICVRVEIRGQLESQFFLPLWVPGMDFRGTSDFRLLCAAGHLIFFCCPFSRSFPYLCFPSLSLNSNPVIVFGYLLTIGKWVVLPIYVLLVSINSPWLYIYVSGVVGPGDTDSLLHAAACGCPVLSDTST